MDPRSLSPTQVSLNEFQKAFASFNQAELMNWYNKYAPWLSKDTIKRYLEEQKQEYLQFLKKNAEGNQMNNEEVQEQKLEQQIKEDNIL